MSFEESTVLGIRVSAAAAITAILFVTVVAALVLRWTVRRKVRRDEAAAIAAPDGRPPMWLWIDLVLKDAVGPLSILMAVAGVHAAAAVLLDQISGVAGAPTIARAVGWLERAGAFAAIVWFTARLGRRMDAALAPLPALTSNAWDDVVLPMAGKAVRLLVPLVAVILGIPLLAIPASFEPVVRNALSLALIATVSLMLMQLVDAAETLVLRRYRLNVGDNLEARTVHTQVTVLKKVATVVIAIFTLASMLMVFQSVRQFGTSILASAGIAGIIVGFAAQRSIATLLAGLQIAITQPIRIDDVVIVEGEWGRIEDITLTYVTVRVWDHRRLVVPITYFIEQPFQNWTRTSADILGTVFLHVDYRAPLAELREELDRILAESPYWDGNVKVLQVTEAREQTLELRALASAADASLAWDLRCEVREKLIAFLQRHHPDSLPRVRAEWHGVTQA